MNGILTGSSLALNTKTFSEMREYVEIINKSAERLLPVINNILDISKIEKKKTDIFCEKVDLIDFLESIVSPFENKAKQKNLNFIFSHFIKKSLFVNLDKTKFSQAIINVLDNSIKFTEKGFIQFSINLIEETESKISVLIKIKDTGIGIKKEFYEKLFVPFEQEEKYMTRKFGGTGLGLPISKELIEYMGGKIYFESEEGKGTTFFIEISFEKCSSIENLETELKKNEKDEKISILAAEDDELGVILLKKIFQDKKFDLDIVENGKKAIEYYEKKDYDLIFMDLQMPVMDGITATTLIREKEKSSKKSIPIIALTGHAFELDKKKCLDSGMNDFLSKPFKMNELFRTLNKYIS
jgi:CheY-like chemotaxis protein